MEPKVSSASQSLVRFLTIFFQLFHVLFWLWLVFLVGLSIYSLVYSHDYLPEAEYMVYVSQASPEATVEWADGKTVPVILENGMIWVKTEESPGSIVAIHSIVFLLMSVAILLSIRFTLRILRSVREGAFLVAENAIRLRWIGLLSVLTVLLYKSSSIISSVLVGQRITSANLDFREVNILSFENFEAIFSGLFLVVIAEVFRIGAELKEESDLTI